MNDPRPETFALYFLLAQHLTRAADEALAPAGVTSRQWLLLALLTRRFPEPPTLSQAAEAYGTSRQNVKQLAEQLQDRGFVALRPDPEDARKLRIHVLPTVATTFDAPEEQAREAELLRGLFAPLSDDDVVTLRRILRRWAPRPEAPASDLEAACASPSPPSPSSTG